MKRKLITVRDVMKKDVDFVDGKMTVMEALQMMKNIETKSLIVQKRDDNDEYGIVLLSDIVKKVLAKDRSPNRVNIFEIMSKPVINIDPNMDIRYCARLFEQFGLTRAPVVENRTIIGLVSATDIVMKGLLEFD